MKVILTQLKTYGAKYGTITKELNGNKSAYDECQPKVAKMEDELNTVQNLVQKHTEEASFKLEGISEMQDLMKSITNNRTDIEKTIADCKATCKSPIKKLNEIKDTAAKEYKKFHGSTRRWRGFASSSWSKMARRTRSWMRVHGYIVRSHRCNGGYGQW